MSNEEIREIKRTPDSELLIKFPQYTRSFLREIKKNIKKRILVLDIETSPIKIQTTVWSLWEQNLPIKSISMDWFIICWSAKWLGERKVFNSSLTPKEALVGNDKRVVSDISKLLDEADIVIAHNGDKFDIRKINSRILKHNLDYPSPYKTFDTLKIVKKEFGLTSNKLDYVCTFLGIKGKIKTGIELWEGCLAGDKKALAQMQKYCDNDVVILEAVYMKLLKYIRSNPKSWTPRISDRRF